MTENNLIAEEKVFTSKVFVVHWKKWVFCKLKID